MGCWGLLWFGVERRERWRLLNDHRWRTKRPGRGRSRLAARCDGVSRGTADDGYGAGTDAPDASEVWGRQLIAGRRPTGNARRNQGTVARGGDGGGYAGSALVDKGILWLLDEDGTGVIASDGIVWDGKGGHDRGDRDRRSRGADGGVGPAAAGHTAFFRRGGGGRGIAGQVVVGRGVVPVLLLDADGEW